MDPARTPNWQGYTDRDLPLPGTPIPGRFGYRRVTAEEYHAFPAISAGLLKSRTAAEMFAGLTQAKKDTDALTIGTLVHMAALEPETSWATKFALADIPINNTTGKPYGVDSQKGKAAWEAAAAMHPGKIVVTQETLKEYLDTCASIQRAIAVNPDAMQELTEVDTEVSGIMWHPRWNCFVKWRPDVLPHHCRHIADIKTSSRHVADFKKDAWQFGYFQQAVWYAHCHEQLLAKMNLECTKFVFIVASKQDDSRYPRPVMCRVYDVPLAGDMNMGVTTAKAVLGIPEGLSKVDVFLDCVRNYIEAGQPTDFAGIRRCWPAYELEAGEKGRWVLAD